MRPGPATWLAIGACLTGVGGITAQAYPVKRCEAPAVPLGHLHGMGQVSYLLDGTGRPDTASLRVAAADGISLGGLRSAAVRHLSGCTFQVPTTKSRDAQSVVQTIRFDDLKVLSSDPEVIPQFEAAAVIVPPRLPAVPVEATDSLLEEQPRQLGCDRAPSYPQAAGMSHSRSDNVNAVTASQREYSGSILVKLIVGIDGRVEPGSIEVISTTNSRIIQIYRPVFANCRYAPGRIGGVPVRTIVRADRGMTVANGS